ncbi:MAG: hypothetical protein ACXWP0_13615 [Ktedonobacterales bacterium]
MATNTERTPQIPDGLPPGYFIVQVPERDEWLAGVIGYASYGQYVYATDYIDANDLFDRPAHYPTAEAARRACWQDVTPENGEVSA